MNSKSRIVLAILVGAAVGGAAIHGLHAQTKPKAYTVTELQTLDTKTAADVANRITKTQKAQAAVIPHWRRKSHSHGRTAAAQRIAITEWDNLDKAQAFFKSKEWADIGPERDKALKTIRRYAVEQRD